MGDPVRADEEAIATERAVRDAQAEIYDEHRAGLAWEYAAMDACFERLLGLLPTHRVLDAGCGTGAHVPWLLERTASVVGVDHSAHSLEIARRRLTQPEADRVELLEGDIRSLPLADRSVDRVLSAGVIQHLPSHAAREESVRNFFRVLVPSGIAAVSVYKWLGHSGWRRNGAFVAPDGRIPYHGFTPREIRRLFEQAGFVDVVIAGAAPVPALAKRFAIGLERQTRLAFTPVGRLLGDYLVVAGVRPA